MNTKHITRRRALLGATLAAFMALPGCATKGDVRTLQESLVQMQAHQDSVLRNIQVQNRLMLDTLRRSMQVTLDSRGQTSHRIDEVSKLVEQTRLLVGENLSTMRDLIGRLDAVEAKISNFQAPAAPVTGSADATAQSYYDRGMQRLGEQAYAAARLAFQNVVRQYRDDPRAPDAQYQIGEVYYAEQNWNEAYAAFEAVVANWPASARAPEALFRAGVIAQERKDNARARAFYDRVIRDYAGSDAARAAETRRRGLPR